LVGSGWEKAHEGRDTSACSQAATPARDLVGECLAEGGQHLFDHAQAQR
jgi:hypothetical protein